MQTHCKSVLRRRNGLDRRSSAPGDKNTPCTTRRGKAGVYLKISENFSFLFSGMERRLACSTGGSPPRETPCVLLLDARAQLACGPLNTCRTCVCVWASCLSILPSWCNNQLGFIFSTPRTESVFWLNTFGLIPNPDDKIAGESQARGCELLEREPGCGKLPANSLAILGTKFLVSEGLRKPYTNRTASEARWCTPEHEGRCCHLATTPEQFLRRVRGPGSGVSRTKRWIEIFLSLVES